MRTCYRDRVLSSIFKRSGERLAAVKEIQGIEKTSLLERDKSKKAAAFYLMDALFNEPAVYLVAKKRTGRPSIFLVFLFLHDNYATSIQMSRVPFTTIDISARFDHRATDDIANLHDSRRNTWRSWQFAMVLQGDNRTCQPRWNLSSWSDVFSERCGNKCKGITLLRRPGSCGWSRRKTQKKMADFGSGERSRDPRQERSIASGGNWHFYAFIAAQQKRFMYRK